MGTNRALAKDLDPIYFIHKHMSLCISLLNKTYAAFQNQQICCY